MVTIENQIERITLDDCTAMEASALDARAANVLLGDAGIDIAQISGSFSEYLVTRTDTVVWFSDTVAGRDGTDFLKGVEKANLRDVSRIVQEVR